MSVVVTTPPLHTSIVDLVQLGGEITAPDSAANFLANVARQVTATIETYCQRDFGRAFYTETLAGFGSPLLMLARTPLALVTAITADSSPVTDYSIDNAEAGLLYRQLGWLWSYGLGWFLDEFRIPGGETRPFQVQYWAGYLLPDDDVFDATISVAAADKSFNRVSGTFPYLVAGDRITSSEFNDAANNGTWTVVTRTATKITVAEAGLVDEAAGATGNNPKTLLVRTLPDDIERAAIDAAKARYFGKERDPMVVSRSITGLSLTYAGAQTNAPLSIPPTAAALLAPYRRAA